MEQRITSTPNNFLTPQKCFLSYTGSNGKVNSTVLGHGWSDVGIKAFNRHLLFVIEDRKKFGNRFDTGMIHHCKALTGLANQSRTRKRRSKADQNSKAVKREKCLTPRVIENQQAQKEQEINNTKEGTTSKHEFIDNMFV